MAELLHHRDAGKYDVWPDEQEEYVANRTAAIEAAQSDLYLMLKPEHQALVDAGVYYMEPGQSYPVLRWTGKDNPQNKGRLAPGTGLIIGAGADDKARKASSDSWWKKTTEYRELMRRAVPADLDVKRRGSLGWLLEQGFVAAEGGDVTKKFDCSHCGEPNQVVMWKRPDGKTIIQILEMVMGRAPEQKDVNIHSENLFQILNENMDVDSLRVYAVSPEESTRRRTAIEAPKDEVDGVYTEQEA